MSFPIPLTSMHQIEWTTYCSLRCPYCPSRDIVDNKYANRGGAIHMSRDNFLRSLEWVKYFVARGTQKEVNVCGIGESLLHPDFVEYMRLTREAIGPDVKITFATNGLKHDEETVAAIAPYKPEVWVSLHRPEKAGRAVEMYKKYGLLVGISQDPALNANDWASQVDWFDSGGARFPCPWMTLGWGFVFADGRVSSCCLDASGSGVLGHVRDEIGSIKTKPFETCKRCYQVIDPTKWDQKNGVAR